MIVEGIGVCLSVWYRDRSLSRKVIKTQIKIQPYLGLA